MWQKLFGRKDIAKHQGEGTFEFQIVGESYYQKELSKICGGKTEDGHNHFCDAILVPEPGNKYDKNAIAVYIEGRKVGHIDRTNAVKFSKILSGRRMQVSALIKGGWIRPDGDEGSFGVTLDL